MCSNSYHQNESTLVGKEKKTKEDHLNIQIVAARVVVLPVHHLQALQALQACNIEMCNTITIYLRCT